MPVKPMLDDIELQLVQDVEAEDEEVIVQHGVPVLEGDFLQDTGRRASRISLTGIMVGEEVADALKKLRNKFRAAEPVPFVADIATATKVDKVLIEEMGIRDLAGKPERFEYALTMREFIPPPATEREEPPPPSMNEEIQEQASATNSTQINQATQDLGTLEVLVEVEDGADYQGIRVVIERQTSTGESVSTFSDEQVDGLYRFTNIEAGDYTVRLELT